MNQHDTRQTAEIIQLSERRRMMMRGRDRTNGDRNAVQTVSPDVYCKTAWYHEQEIENLSRIAPVA